MNERERKGERLGKKLNGEKNKERDTQELELEKAKGLEGVFALIIFFGLKLVKSRTEKTWSDPSIN